MSKQKQLNSFLKSVNYQLPYSEFMDILKKDFEITPTLLGQILNEQNFKNITSKIRLTDQLVNDLLSKFNVSKEELRNKLGKHYKFEFLYHMYRCNITDIPLCDICKENISLLSYEVYRDKPIDQLKKYISYEELKNIPEDKLQEELGKNNKWSVICNKCSRTSEIRKYVNIISEYKSLQEKGIKHHTQLDDVRKKISEGVKKSMNKQKESFKKTMLEKYGVENPQQVEEFKQKRKETLKRKPMR